MLLFAKLMLFVALVSLLLYVVKYASDIRSFFAGKTYKQVAGAHTNLENEVKKDIADYLNSAKSQILNLKLKDIYEPLSRVNKINNDFRGAREAAEEMVTQLLKK